MAKIWLFGSHNIKGVPQYVIDWIDKCNQAGNSFIVGDRLGSDVAFHRALSLVGADKVEVVGINRILNNKFNFNERKLNTVTGIKSEEEIKDNSDIKEFKDILMLKECDLAICLYDGQSKKVDKLLQICGIMNKECSIIKMC